MLDNINELVDYGLVDLREEGRAKRPVRWYDEISIDISLPARADDESNALVT